MTHHISLCLPGAEYFVSLSDGRIEKQGQVADMDQSELQTELIEEDEEAEKVEAADEVAKKDSVDPSDPKEVERLAAKADPKAPDSTGASAGGSAADATTTAKGKLVEEETRQTGRVKWTVYSLYLRSAGYPTWALIFLLILAGRVFRVADRWWFRVWGESYHLSDSFFFRLFLPQRHQLSLTSFDAQPFDTLNAPEFPSASDHVGFYLAGYGIICLINLCVLVFGILVAFNGSFKASRALFTDSLTRVVHAPFRHFDATPVGRILSRYSQDMSTIDGSLMDQIRICMTHALSFVVQTSVICVVSPYFIPPAVLIIAAYVYYSLMVSDDRRSFRTSADITRIFNSCSTSKRVGIFDASNRLLVRQSSPSSAKRCKESSRAAPSVPSVDSSANCSNRSTRCSVAPMRTLSRTVIFFSDSTVSSVFAPVRSPGVR